MIVLLTSDLNSSRFCLVNLLIRINEVDFDDLTVMICGLHDVRFAIVIILSTSTGQALVNPKFKFAMWIGNNIWFMKITILTLFPKFGFE